MSIQAVLGTGDPSGPLVASERVEHLRALVAQVEDGPAGFAAALDAAQAGSATTLGPADVGSAPGGAVPAPSLPPTPRAARVRSTRPPSRATTRSLRPGWRSLHRLRLERFQRLPSADRCGRRAERSRPRRPVRPDPAGVRLRPQRDEQRRRRWVDAADARHRLLAGSDRTAQPGPIDRRRRSLSGADAPAIRRQRHRCACRLQRRPWRRPELRRRAPLQRNPAVRDKSA